MCGAIRLVSTTKALGADDITFNVGPIGLWSLGEITSGFLVLCIPSVPKAFKDSIIARTFFGLANRLSRNSAPGDSRNSRRGLPSWYRPDAPRRPQRSRFSEIDGAMGSVIQLSMAQVDGDLTGPRQLHS